MKLITELHEEAEISYITEADEYGSKNHFIKGIFLMSGIENRNGRIYPENVMDEAVSKYVESKIKNSRAYGELGHPSTPQINLDRVSHLIVDLKKDGKNYIGKAKLVDTPMGNIARGLLSSGAKVGTSSRGAGNVTPGKNGSMMVSNFVIATAGDLVADPSAPDAYVESVMEGVNWVYNASNDSWYQESLHETKKSLKKMSMNQIEESKLGIFESFISRLSSKKR